MELSDPSSFGPVSVVVLDDLSSELDPADDPPAARGVEAQVHHRDTPPERRDGLR
jgi:hypothetical protein